MNPKPTSSVATNTMLTVGEIADRWRCSTKQVRRLIATRRITVHRIGRLVRVSEADLLAYERSVRGLP